MEIIDTLTERWNIIKNQTEEHQKTCKESWGSCPDCQFFEGWQQGFLSSRILLLKSFQNYKRVNKVVGDKTYYRIQVAYDKFMKIMEL
jgi:hypothetical protein